MLDEEIARLINIVTQLAKLQQTLSKLLTGLFWEEQKRAPPLCSGILILVLVKTCDQIRGCIQPHGGIYIQLIYPLKEL